MVISEMTGKYKVFYGDGTYLAVPEGQKISVTKSTVIVAEGMDEETAMTLVSILTKCSLDSFIED